MNGTVDDATLHQLSLSPDEYQLIVDTAGVTDATSAQQASGKIAAAVIGLARRYSHSAAEMFDLTDVQGIINLVCATTRQLTSRDQLSRL